MVSLGLPVDEQVARRTQLLEQFLDDLRAYDALSARDTDEGKRLRSSLNRSMQSVRDVVIEAGCHQTFTITAGGVILRRVDPFVSLFQYYDDTTLIPSVIDILENTLGVVQSNGYMERVGGQQRNRSSVLPTIERICRRFPQVARQLQSRYNSRTTLEINDEYDVQDLLHALLRLDFGDVRREEWTPSYAGASARMDFLLKQERIVIEVKKTRPGLTARELGDQLLVDIARYQSHADCGRLICFVYDPEFRIGNPTGLERDLTWSRDGFHVNTFISPADNSGA